MPTRKTRMALTLPDDLDQALRGLAAAVEKPASAVVVELLVEMVPQLEALTKVANAAKAGNKAAAKRALTHAFGDAYASMVMATQGELLEAMDKAKKARK